MGVPVKKDVNLQSEISSDMKRNRGLIWLLASLCALVLTVLADNQEHHVACMQAVEHRTAASNVWEPQQEHSHEADRSGYIELHAGQPDPVNGRTEVIDDHDVHRKQERAAKQEPVSFCQALHT